MLLQSLKLAGLVAIGLPASSLGRTISKRSVSSAQAWMTSNDGTYQLANYTAPVQGSGSGSGISSTWNLSVDDSSSGHKQTIDGFGGTITHSTPAVTDATVTVFSELSSDQQTALLNDLFTSTTASGASFNLMRHTIASSDLSSSVYTYDDASNADTSLSSWDLTSAGTSMISWISKFASASGSLKLLGSCWSPPGWMKLNGVTSGSTNNNNLNTDYADAYAEYFVKYIQAFANGGVNVDAITIQNEPLNSQSGYPTMYLDADSATSLIQNNVGPALAKAGLKTEIWAYDHNTDVPSYPQTVLNGAGSYVSNVAWHCYAQNNNWSALTDFHNTNPDATQYMTECWTSPTNSWYSTIDFTMGPLQNWAAGVIAWTLGTDTNYSPHLSGGCSTCRGIVTVDTSSGSYSKTADYYWLAQFSRFLPRGSIALSTGGSYDYGNGDKVEAQAFVQPDGTRVVVIQNGFNNAVEVTVAFSSGETWSGPLYSQSLTTWLLP
ncbi:glycoside hydrolase superfamily [Talaromyces proteolyticus]|uniref:Glycoside hydrolase superfamily n=1 Tax=Talaromyces proteolyticus TaxID=1131652 RepID=A0AAD4L184_9EURO|nr:glycoside hydrolase superfamily [Talaromyces proteolyticus]KAH8705692.1 glycoside hydrolase superfamily [Talaromyces proteolyticus]